MLTMGCSATPAADIGRPSWSPSGEYQLIVGADTPGSTAHFYLTNRQGVRVFTAADRFDLRHNTYFFWDKDDQVWVYSGDLGLFIWRNDPKSGWTRRAYEKGRDALPSYLQEHLDMSILEVL